MITTLPSLKRPNGKNLTKWIEDVAKFVSGNMSLYTSASVRASVRDQIVNLDLYNNRLHPEDFISLLNPLDLKTIDDTRELQHFPVATSIIDLMVGEELGRPFEPTFDITNNEGIDEKRERLRAYVQKEVARLEKEYQGDDETLKLELKKLTRYLKYTYKDITEKKASALFEHYNTSLNFEEMWIEGFRRVWLMGEEAYAIDIINGEPVAEVLNTANVRLFGGGRSSKYEDYDVIVVEDHKAPGYLIDRYGKMFTDEEVERILNYQTDSGRWNKAYGDVTHEFNYVGDILGTEFSDNYTDDKGCIRHLRIRFKAYKQIKKILYQDPATGEEQVKTVAKNYRLAPGEVLKETVWIVEWWIATLIGADIVVDAHPIPIRYNRLSSPAEGHPGVVGTVYNINEREVVPPMSKIRSFQYLYDVVMDRAIVAMSKNVGPILEMDFAKKPVKWTTMKWMDYMFKYNTKFIDNFKEISKGKHVGQLAGNLASGRDQQQSFDFSQYIQQLLNIAEYLEKAMADTLGVVPQRMGAVSNRETVGGVERATSQSSHITEWYFYRHEQTKLRFCNIFVEAAKTALKDNPKKLKYFLDSKIQEILDITEEDLANVDIGVSATNSKKSQEYKQLLQQGAHAFMQNGGDFSFVFDVINSNSMAEKRRMIEEYENDQKAAAQEGAQAEQQSIKEERESRAKSEDDKLAMEKYISDTKNAVTIQVKQMELQAQQQGVDLDKTRTLAEIQNDIMELSRKMNEDANVQKNTEKELDLKEKEVQIKDKVASKPTPAKVK